MKVVDLGDRNQAFSLKQDETAKLGFITSFPAGSTKMTIVCLGPNNLYYYTKGNIPIFGLNKDDKGVIKPLSSASPKLTSVMGSTPVTFADARFGPVKFAVFHGTLKLFGVNYVKIPKVIEKLVEILSKVENPLP